VWNENDITHIAWDDQYMLGISQNRFDFYYNAHGVIDMDNILKITTNFPMGWTATVWADQAGTIPVPNNWLSISPASGAGGAQPDETHVLTTTHAGDVTRTAYIHIKAGRLSLVVTVSQIPSVFNIPKAGTPPVGVTPYLGAFWRATETGERIIRFPDVYNADVSNRGPWRVSVAWYDAKWEPIYGDGIVFSKDMLTTASLNSRGISFSSNMTPQSAENYKIKNGSAFVSGVVDASNTDIMFRIGLQRNFTAWHDNNNPARYAVVLLTYGTPAKEQKIFIRQGEGADYLMYNEAINSGGFSHSGSSKRPAAVKFSPYNLKDPNGGTPTAVTTAPSGIGYQGGGFVDYPTKAGYYFRFNYNTQAFAPHSPHSNISGWNDTQDGVEYWSSNQNVTETCPDGYHRPTDGSTSSHVPSGANNVNNSEFRQSLWLNPQTGDAKSSLDNSFWGYYADGWFDRRVLGQVLSGADYANSAVAVGTADIAYQGRLFFNPNTHASLFFPSNGYRMYAYGNMAYPGTNAYYWTSSSISASSAWMFYMGASATSMRSTTRTYGFMLRCAKY
jgi:hypothetical protein